MLTNLDWMYKIENMHSVLLILLFESFTGSESHVVWLNYWTSRLDFLVIFSAFFFEFILLGQNKLYMMFVWMMNCSLFHPNFIWIFVSISFDSFSWLENCKFKDWQLMATPRAGMTTWFHKRIVDPLVQILRRFSLSLFMILYHSIASYILFELQFCFVLLIWGQETFSFLSTISFHLCQSSYFAPVLGYHSNVTFKLIRYDNQKVELNSLFICHPWEVVGYGRKSQSSTSTSRFLGVISR